MEKIFIYLFIVYVCCLKLVRLSPILPYRSPTKDELEKIAVECIEQTNIDPEIIKTVIKTESVPKENTKKYKKYLACSYKKQGYLSQDGSKIIYDNLFQFLELFYNTEDLKYVEHCKLIRESDPGELCFKNLACLLDGLKKLENEKHIHDLETNDVGN